MNQCQNCGQINDQMSNFCRFCGANLVQPQKSNDYPDSPRPYVWKTDEYQVKDQSARKTQRIEQVQQMIPPSAMNPQMSQQSMGYPNNMNLGAGYRCPRCGTQNPPYITRQISTAGWITFGLLLFFTLIFFWIGLLIKEDVRVCPVCGLRTNYF
jgi:RNA polymerase subunit RPABC4/transcription elongation factor Spt4